MANGPMTDAELEKLHQRIATIIAHNPPPGRVPFSLSSLEVARLIDHTLLAPGASPAQIQNLCTEALHFSFSTVCVRPNHVSVARQALGNNPDVGVACVVGFPEGTYATAEKVAEAKQAVADGATELDMVLNYEVLKAHERHYNEVYHDILAVREAAPGCILKVIHETSQLAPRHIHTGCMLSCMAGADFVKTSTGFRGRGASVEDVEEMRKVCDFMEREGHTKGKRVKVKASGGIRTIDDLARFVRVGAERIGASAGLAIMAGYAPGRAVLDAVEQEIEDMKHGSRTDGAY